ncbi:MAG TPA: hypothetical protein PKE47_06610, partial [Verrucomicrobiota bacterium]|nr:hypothetical protein [Verrucomicrobiota bacterium]
MNTVLSSQPPTRRAAAWGPLAAAALLVSLPAPAALILSVGDHLLQPNQAGQQVELFVENTGGPLAYGGLDFSVRVGDGTAGPALTGVDLLAGPAVSAHPSYARIP